MTYREFKDAIGSALHDRAKGMTWNELKITLDLPYDRPCPEWVKRLEREIGLVRERNGSRAALWRIKNGSPRT